ncbi:MAG: NmrA family NAD(P)-binding protein, partial [Chloroflexi bacterium]|nr:NmrA family NAD(P)-binding protein [Chloroflexota bacterium]
RAVYHICPNMHPEEVAIGRLVIGAAREAGVGRFVYHSVLHPQAGAMPHHWNKLRVEEALFESGLPFTILQPTAYMQNLLAGWEALRQQGLYRVPYPVETRLSFVDLCDVAEAAAIVLTRAGHLGATYELAGTAPLTQTEVATALSAGPGRPVRAEAVPLDRWEAGARAAGLSDYAVETLLRMFRYYARHGLTGNPNVLRWLLGRPPATLADFVSRTAQEWPA